MEVKTFRLGFVQLLAYPFLAPLMFLGQLPDGLPLPDVFLKQLLLQPCWALLTGKVCVAIKTVISL
jgi:hypothetical protein